jgi:hypothetical protein
MIRRRIIHRLTGLFVRWGLVEHPYGREYAVERYTVTGRRVPESGGRGVRTRAAVVAALLVLASVLATGLLVGV